MMFHALIGGELYTSLAHRSQGYVDLSTRCAWPGGLMGGRAPAAICARWAAGDATGLRQRYRAPDGRSDLPTPTGDQHLTFYPSVLPVRRHGDVVRVITDSLFARLIRFPSVPIARFHSPSQREGYDA